MEVTKLEEGLGITIPGISDIEVIERQKKLLKEVDALAEKKPVKRVILRVRKLKKCVDINNTKVLEKQEKLLKILGSQSVFNDYEKELFAIINLPYNKEQMRNHGCVASTAIDCFDYGVMIGKRMEREREVKKLERLKIENEKLKRNLMEINNLCTKTEAIIR